MNYIAVTVLHLTRTDFYRMNPGLFFDLIQIRNDSMPKSGSDNEY